MTETGPIYDKKFGDSENHGQNRWKKIEKSSKIGLDKKSVIPTFAFY